MTWIVCAGMIRSGSTLQFQLASSIVEKAGVGVRLPYVKETDFDTVYHRASGQTKLKIFKAHVCTGMLHDLAKSGEAAVIYSYRDIRDVAASAMEKFGKSFVELLRDGWLDQAIVDYHLWKSMPNVMVSKYEEFKSNIEKEADSINSFLGKFLDADSIKTIANDYEVSKQIERIAALKSTVGRDIGPDEIIFDPREQLHHNHIGDGAVGKWRQSLSSSQLLYLNTRFRNWLIDSGYETSEELSLQCQRTFPTVSISELSEYWHLSSTSDVARIERSEVTLRAEKELTQQMRGWAEKTEALLKAEREQSSQENETLASKNK